MADSTESAPKPQRGRPPSVRNVVLAQLAQEKRATAVDLNTKVAYLDSLVRTGYIERAGVVKVTPGKGRPRTVFRLTNKGRARAKALATA